MSTSKQKKPKHSPGTLTREVPGGAVGVAPANDEDCLYRFTAHAAAIWLAIDGKKTASEIESLIRKKHKLPPRFTKDLASFLAYLAKEKLIKWVK